MSAPAVPLTAVMLLAAAYVTAMIVVRRRHPVLGRPARARPARARPARGWPGLRAAAFFAGLATIAVAVSLTDDEVLTVHMVQHLLLIMVAPPLLVYGRPITLLLHATRNPAHRVVLGILRSRWVRVLTWPPLAVVLFTVVVATTHLTPLMSLVLHDEPLHDTEHVVYLIAGYLYFLPVVGSEPLRWRPSLFGRYLLLMAAMPVDITTGAVLMLTTRPLFGYSLDSLHQGGLIMLAGSELIMVALAIALAARFILSEDSRPPEPDLALEPVAPPTTTRHI